MKNIREIDFKRKNIRPNFVEVFDSIGNRQGIKHIKCGFVFTTSRDVYVDSSDSCCPHCRKQSVIKK